LQWAVRSARSDRSLRERGAVLRKLPSFRNTADDMIC